MNIFSLTGLFILLTTLLMGSFVLSKARVAIQYIWGFFCLCVALWGLGDLFIGMAADYQTALLWWRISYIGVIFIPGYYLLFALAYARKLNIHNFIGVNIISIIFIIFNIGTSFFINELGVLFDDLYYIINPSPLYAVFVFYFFADIVVGAVIMWRYGKKKSVIHSNQVKYFMLATITGFGGGLFAFLPVFGIDLYPYLNVLIAVSTILVVYAMFKHNLMNLKEMFQRGLIYSALLFIIIIIYVIFLSAIQVLFAIESDYAFMISSILTTALGIYTVPSLERFFRKVTDKIFFKDKYDFQEAVYKLSSVLNYNLAFQDLLNELMLAIKEIFKTEKVIYLLGESLAFTEEEGYVGNNKYGAEKIFKIFENQSKKILLISRLAYQDEENRKNSLKILRDYSEQYGIKAAVAIEISGKNIGYILLGKKKSGDVYNNMDLNLLKTISHQAAVAFEKARLYEEVKSYSRLLEYKVEERTKTIQNLQEDQKQMMLEVAHGLQTPLTIMKAEMSNLHSSGIEGNKINNIEASIDRISKFIYDMLRLANLESANMESKTEKFSLSDLLSEMVESFEVITADKKIKIKSDIENNIDFIGNRAEIEEAITNLVSNSVKYLREDKKREIFISLKLKNKNIEIKIADTGIGIKKENLNKLFSRFYRVKEVEGSTKRGTGLGLAISKRIIERHQGKITVTSEYEKGTEFLILLPVFK